MVRKCCVALCDTRSVPKRQNNRTLFQITDANKQKWMAILYPHMKKYGAKKLYICDLHFKEEDVEHFFVTKCFNGTLSKIPRAIPKLVEGCMPCIFHDDEGQNGSISEREKLNIDSFEMPFETILIPDKNLPLTSNSFEELKLEVQTDEMQLDDKNLNLGSRSFNVFNTDMQTDEMKLDYENPPLASSSFKACSSSEKKNVDINNFQCFKIEEDNRRETPACSSSLSTASHNYNVEELYEDLSALLMRGEFPENWGFSKIPKGLFFWYFGDSIMAMRSVIVEEDMTVEVRADGVIISSIEFLKVVTNVNDIILTMNEISRLSLCKGIDENYRCPKGLFDPKSLRNPQRCFDCSNKRKTKLNYENKKKKRSDKIKYKMRREIINLKRKMQRRYAQIEKLTENIGELRAEYAKASETAIFEAIKNSPTGQQRAVEACLDGAKCKGLTGVIPERQTHKELSKNKMMDSVDQTDCQEKSNQTIETSRHIENVTGEKYGTSNGITRVNRKSVVHDDSQKSKHLWFKDYGVFRREDFTNEIAWNRFVNAVVNFRKDQILLKRKNKRLLERIKSFQDIILKFKKD